MKILHIVPTYLPAFRYGGPIKTVHELNKWLVKKGAEVTVYTTNIDGKNTLNVPLNQEVDIEGVKVFYFPVSFRPWQYSCELRRALAKNIKNFDLIHITSVFLAASTLGAYYAKKFDKPYIISPRGSLMDEPLKKGFLKELKKKIYLSLIEKRNLSGAAAIHFTTDMEKDEYLSADLPLKEVIVIPNGFDIGTSDVPNIDVNVRTSDVQKLNFRQKFNISAGKKIVLFLSRLNWKKGLDTLIPAFAEVLKKEPEAILVIAGGDDKNYKKEVLKIIDSVNIKTSDVLRTSDVQTDVPKIENPNIIFTGMLLGDDKIAAYRESDVFVLPSYSENFGMAVVEAMAVGKPVVVTKGVGVSKEVEKAAAGIVIEKDVNQLTLAILKILNNPDLAKKMGEAGRKLVKTEFSLQEIAERFIEEYSKLIEGLDGTQYNSVL